MKERHTDKNRKNIENLLKMAIESIECDGSNERTMICQKCLEPFVVLKSDQKINYCSKCKSTVTENTTKEIVMIPLPFWFKK